MEKRSTTRSKQWERFSKFDLKNLLPGPVDWPRFVRKETKSLSYVFGKKILGRIICGWACNGIMD